MVREAELEEMEKRWREENDRIMSQHPSDAHYPDPGRPAVRPNETPSATEAPEPKLPFDEIQPEDEVPVEKRPLP